MTADTAREDVILTTCPRDCYDSCGMWVHRRDGLVTAVRGNPNHPVSRGALCGKCSTAYNREWRDPAQRLTQPMRRAGAKGARCFEPIAWETAFAEIAARLHEIIETSGAQSILNAHYTGTISLLACIAPMRFFNRLGSTEVTPDTICNMAGHVALRYMYGSSLDGFDPRAAADGACIVVWGVKVVISDELPRGVSLAHKGRWLGTDAPGANVNVLNRGQKSDMGESTAVHSVEVTVAALAATQGRLHDGARNAH